MDKTGNRKIKSEVIKYVKRLNKKFKVEKSILFGSRARDDYLDISDVDLIVISKDFSNINFRKRMNEAIEYWNGDVDLEVICYTPEEFEKMRKRIGLVKKAVEEGITLKI
mgnify:FL=1